LAAAFGWIKWLHELREKRKERTAKECVEAELRETRRRATDSSPLFLISLKPFNGVTTPSAKPTEHFFFPAGHPACFLRDEVAHNVMSGESIYLIVESRQSCLRDLRKSR